MDHDLALKAAHPMGRIVAVLKQIGAPTQITYEEKLGVADRIVQRFRETGFQCELRWFGLPSRRAMPSASAGASLDESKSDKAA
jgi:hypothetical protein